jgi:FKBP-type peptidyl-prolyl cis-trans isomerase FkpA
MYRKVLFALLAAALLLGCKKDEGAGIAEAASPDVLDGDTSYAFGMFIASQFSVPGIKFDYPALLQGYQDTAEAKETRFTMEDAFSRVQAAYYAAVERESEKFQRQETEFLAENSKKEGVVITPSGLQYEVISRGSGPLPSAEDTVRVNYEGTLIDGTVFDSSYSRGEPVEFPLGGVIAGWTEGIQLMNEGSTYRFYIPSGLAYGAEGNRNIPPYSALIFEVELLSIVEP